MHTAGVVWRVPVLAAQVLTQASWPAESNSADQEEDPATDEVPRHGPTDCHSKGPEALTSGSYRCLVYTQYKSVYCDWPHPIC